MIRLDNSERSALLDDLIDMNNAVKITADLEKELTRLGIKPYHELYTNSSGRNFIDDICGDHPFIDLTRKYYGALSPSLNSESANNREFFDDVAAKTREVRNFGGGR